MKNLVKIIICIIVAGTIITSCSPDAKSEETSQTTVSTQPKWDNRIQFTCMWWRDTVLNYSVMTVADADKAFKKVYTWSMDTPLGAEGRKYYEGYLANDGVKILSAGTTIGSACEGVPNP